MSRGRRYDETFFAYTDEQALRSARALLPVVAQALAPRSVLDVGCGRGGWLAVWKELGATDVVGVDGDYVDRNALQIAQGEHRAADLAAPLALGRRFDLVQSLEVAEHLPASAAGTFVDSLCAHGDLILFSAAPPGQGGTGHVNEQPYDYWRRQFAARGYACFDWVRPQVCARTEIEPWYRFNTLLYVSGAARSELPPALLRTRIPEASPVPDLAPRWFRARRELVRRLPNPVVEWLSRIRMWTRAKAVTR